MIKLDKVAIFFMIPNLHGFKAFHLFLLYHSYPVVDFTIQKKEANLTFQTVPMVFLK